ncbi:MAG: glycosyltransferase family 39 protein [Tepidisphaerales bacterium]
MTPPEPTPDKAAVSPWPMRYANGLILAAIVFAAVCRLAQYLARISFWHDEAYVVLNVLHRGYGQLLGALDLGQTAPPAFLWGLKTSASLLGANELGFRLVPVLGSILALPLFWLLARRVLTPMGVVLAVAMFCLSPKLLEHTAEVKQYSTDVLAAVLLTLLATAHFVPPCLRASIPLDAATPCHAIPRLALLALAAAVLFWLAETSVFVFAGLALALAPAVFRSARFGWLAYLVCLAVAGASFLALYKLSIKPQSVPLLYSYWADYMANWHRWYRLPVWAVARLFWVANYAYDPLGFLVLPLAVFGAVSLHRQGKGLSLAILALPIAVVFLAACADRYPMGKRVTLFLTPAVLLLAAAGATALADMLPARARRAWPLAPAVLLAPALGIALWHLAIPRQESHLRPAVEFLHANRAADEDIFVVGNNSRAIFQVYWQAPDKRISYSVDLPASVAAKRFWVVFEFDPSQGMRKRLPSLQRARAIAAEQKSFVGTGGAAYLFVK